MRDAAFISTVQSGVTLVTLADQYSSSRVKVMFVKIQFMYKYHFVGQKSMTRPVENVVDVLSLPACDFIASLLNHNKQNVPYMD